MRSRLPYYRRNTFSRAALLAIVAALFADTALANDSVAVLAAGGLRFVPNDNIEMVDEDLYISPDKVRVRYLFENHSQHDIKLRVAFPLPPVPGCLDCIDDDMPVDWSHHNFLNFTASSDGRPIKIAVDIRARDGNDLDVTDQLKRLGIKISPFGKNVPSLLSTTPEQVKSELMKVGLWDDTGPNWNVHVIYHWAQEFPAGSTVQLLHQYRPAAGHHFVVPPDQAPQQIREYCMDQPIQRRISDMLSSLEAVTATTVDYILTTGRNWAGPIGHFKLTIDKKQPNALVSLCIERIRKASPTTFVFEAESYVPDRDLSIFFMGVR